MAQAGRNSAGRADTAGLFKLEREAHSVASRLPELVIEARRVATTIAHGIHGRRRAGPGETFWQFRNLESGDAAQLIDWRRSASSDRLYVREREWEASHTVWLWPDLSPSMNFASRLAPVTKRDRALVLMLAAAELLVRGGERVGLLGLMPPTASRGATTRMAEVLASPAGAAALAHSQPPTARLARFSAVLLAGDFLDPIETTRERLEFLAANGVSGHLVQVLDPAEETLPYSGRTEFLGVEGGERWVVDRAEALRPLYQAKLGAHRAELSDLATRLGWSFLLHHTDRPASEPLLALLMRLTADNRDYRFSGTAGSGRAGGLPA